MSSADISFEAMHAYHQEIKQKLNHATQIATNAKHLGYDPSLTIESPVAIDLADRVAKLLDMPISERLRGLLKENRTETVALVMASEVASGKYPIPQGQSQGEMAVRIGLAIVTDGVTVAPLQGVSAVRIKENHNHSQYLSVEFAGPMRSAGGTESAFTLVIADRVRRVLGLEKYNANSFEDEASRFVEELRIYERDVGNFQYKISDEDIRKAILNLPVEIDGVWTDNCEVVIHRDLHRISTNRLRGGALRVLNDGIVGKSKKLSKLMGELQIEGWDWLSDLSGGKQQGSEETKATSSHFGDVISGRPVLALPGNIGGFRLRYGRAPNTGIHAVGIHPAVSALLNYPIVVGTQIKVDFPGKAASIAFVDTLETPIVRLKNGNVVKVKDSEHAIRLSEYLDSILYIGDILVSFGDFLENNAKLVPSAYVEEWWVIDFRNALASRYTNQYSAEQELKIEAARYGSFLLDPLHHAPSFYEAERISRITGVPLHPKYLLYWDQVTPNEILELRGKVEYKSLGEIQTIKVPIALKRVLENLGIEHYCIAGEKVVIEGTAANVISRCLALDMRNSDPPNNGWTNSIELVSKISGLQIRSKCSAFVGVRVGRPEKAMPRKMKPPVHGLFPVGRSDGLSRDIVNAARHEFLVIELANLECLECKQRVFSSRCPVCKGQSRAFMSCPNCSRTSENLAQTKCATCKTQLRKSSPFPYPLAHELKKASLRVEYYPVKPLKGVLGLSNETRVPESLEKILLRQKYNLTVYRDGTIRYDITNVPLTHFTPRQIHTRIETLIQLGYAYDIEGRPLANEEQILELLPQDIVIPYEAGTFLVAVSKYADDLLVHHYGMDESYYRIDGPEDVIGHLVIGLAPHTSVGIIGRVIGYTNAQACFASPYWHSAKRRDCDGDGDSIILLMDILLNFSKSFLPSMIGGLMDAPLLIQPFIIPREVQRQAHHMDVIGQYPEQFFKATLDTESPSVVEPIMDVIKNRLGTKDEIHNFHFTHDTRDITVKQNRSSYSTLTSLNEKLDRQIEIAHKIRAVNANEVVKSVLRTHLLPDIIGNTKAFTSQRFRCKKCGTKFRRMPVRGNCLNCSGELQPSVTRGSVEKYLQLGLRLSEKYDVGNYLRSRFIMASEELATLFKPEGQQTNIGDYLLHDELDDDKTRQINTVASSQEVLAKQDSMKMTTERHRSRQNKKRENSQRTLF